MAKKPSSVRRPPAVAQSPAPVAVVLNDAPAAIETPDPVMGAPAPVKDVPADADGPFRWLQMETGLSGPHICLSRRDKHQFSDRPAPDGGPSEAQRLVDAGFAIDCDPPAEA